MDRQDGEHVCDFGSSGQCRCGLHREGATATGVHPLQDRKQQTDEQRE